MTQEHCLSPHVDTAKEIIMQRVAVVAGCWLVFWISVGAIAGGLNGSVTAGVGGAHGGIGTGALFGAMCGVFLAVLASFAWPWIMPKTIDNWMNG
jgi:hypothetical protein